MNRSAELSEDGRYRYRLDRWWGEGPRVVWIMLNPSTADAETDDPTIRRVIRFSREWGYDGCTILNLYPLRTPYPQALKRWLKNPDYRALLRNGDEFREMREGAPLVIAAWGTHALGADVLPPEPHWHHLGLTKDGHPRHPLRLKADTTPIRWSTGEAAAAPTGDTVASLRPARAGDPNLALVGAGATDAPLSPLEKEDTKGAVDD